MLIVAGFWTSLWIFLDFVLDLLHYGPSTAFNFCCLYCVIVVCFVAVLDSSARRYCTKCSRRMSSYAHDKHTLCLHCRNVLCSVENRCRECSSWSKDEMLEYLKHRKPLVAKGKKRSSVATPTTSAPSVSPSAPPVSVSASVASSFSSLPSLASEEGLKNFVQSMLASFLSQPASS